MIPLGIIFCLEIYIDRAEGSTHRRTKEQEERRQPHRGIRTASAMRRGYEAEERYVLAYVF